MNGGFIMSGSKFDRNEMYHNLTDPTPKMVQGLVGLTKDVQEIKEATNGVPFKDLATKEELKDAMEGRGVSAMTPPAPFAGAKGDGTNDASAINTLLQNFDYVYLPANKSFSIGSTIVVPDNTALVTLGDFSELKLTKANIPAVEVGVNSKLNGVRILLASNNTSDLGCGIKVRLDAQSTRALVDKVEVVGTDLTGNGIYVEGTSGSCAFTQFNNMYFTRVKNAMKTNVSLPAYANGFIGNNWVIRSSQRAFYLVGSEGNSFTNIQWNTGAYSIEPIYCKSNFNDFHGFWWDLGVSTVPNQIATFEGTAEGNVIRSSDTISSWVINDLTDTKLNFINTMKDDVFKTVNEASYLPNVWMSANEYKKWGYWFDSKPYGGVQDNILAYADKINTVTSTGKAVSSGTLANAFDPFAGLSTGKPNWNLATGEQAQIKIDLTNPVTPTKRLDFLQVVFSSTLEAAGVKFELSADNGTTWTTVKEVTNNDKRYVVFHDNLTAAKVSANPTNIRITLTKPVNASKDVRVEAIIGRMLSVPGYTFMPRSGGKMYGSLELTKGAITLNPTAASGVANNSPFVDSADNKFKFKNSTGNVVDYEGKIEQIANKTSSQISLLDYEHLKVAINGGYDWSPALQEAINTVKNQTRRSTIVIPSQNIQLASPVKLYSNITLVGSLSKVSEFQTNAQITTLSTANCTFKFDGGNISNVAICGIEFYGHLGATFLETQSTADGFILRYSNIYNCGFVGYDKVFNGRWLGVHFYENHINNGNSAFTLAGADSTIRDNFISVKRDIAATESVCRLEALSLSRFTRNFITGLKARCLSTNSCQKVIFSENWFDISDTCGHYDTNSSDLMFIGNTFAQLAKAVYDQYDAQVVLFGTKDSSYIGNSFSTQDTGRTISIRKNGTVLSDNISFKGNKFKNLVINFPAGESTNIDFDVLYGTTVPTSNVYKQGQEYVKTDTGETYKYLGSIWKVSFKYKEDYGAMPPTTGKWTKMDKRINTDPFPGGYEGWICTQSGEFGTATEPIFNPFGLISE
jgi:hypothetical protein